MVNPILRIPSGFHASFLVAPNSAIKKSIGSSQCRSFWCLTTRCGMPALHQPVQTPESSRRLNMGLPMSLKNCEWAFVCICRHLTYGGYDHAYTICNFYTI